MSEALPRENTTAPPRENTTAPPRETTIEVEQVKRTSGPQTTNGKRWEIQLNGFPSSHWLELFKVSGEATARTLPHRVEFDRASAVFRCDEDQVEHWIASIDTWIASTNARHVIALEKVRRERVDRADAATKERERIGRLNDRFRNL